MQKKIISNWTLVLSMLFGMLICSTGQVLAQEVDRMDTELSTLVMQLDGEAIPLMSLASNNEALPLPETNAVFIQQTGANNYVNTTTSTKASDINIIQNGNANKVEMNITALSLTGDVLQSGNNNSFTDYANDPTLQLQRDIQQSGANQRLVIYGSNSITEDLQMKMQGNARTITIRNFN